MSTPNAWSIALFAALLGWAGCSSPFPRPGTLPVRAAAAPHQVRPAGWSGPFLYVGGFKLKMYELGIATPLHVAKVNPTIYKAAIALDHHGDLCEANGEISGAAVNAYDARTLKFLGGLSGEGAYPALIADHLGYIYASTGGAGIQVYAPGCRRHADFIRRGANAVGPLVFDRSGNLYAGIQPHYAVSVYAPAQRPGHMKLVRQISDGINAAPIALAAGRSGELFVANYNGTGDGYVGVYPAGGSKPTLRITKGIKFPWALAVDSKGRLYVANNPSYWGGKGRTGWISVYAPGGSQPIRKVLVRDPVAIVLDGSDTLYVANVLRRSSIQIYSAGAVKLLQTIDEGSDAPTALLIGAP